MKFFNPFVVKWTAYGLFWGILITTIIAIFTSISGWSYYGELFSHFQVQYLVITTILLVLLLFTRYKYLIIISLICWGMILSQILPWYFPHWDRISNHESNLKIFIANLNTNNKSYDKVLSLVKKQNPDLAIFIEVDEKWINQLDSLQDILPYSFGKPHRFHRGIYIYSRYKIENPQINFFSTENPVIIANLTINNQKLSLIAAHPSAPIRESLFNQRNKQLEEIGKYINTLENPVIMAGDFNITMWSPYYKKFIEETGLKDTRRGFGVLPTWPASGGYAKINLLVSLVLSIPIDGCLVSDEIKVASIKTGEKTDSDHLPLITKLLIN